jgi:hypothetical protein
MPHPLPTAGRSGAHRHLGSSSGVDPWHEHNELPASADATAISAKFNIYRSAAARGQWEAMALGGYGGGGDKKKHKQQTSSSSRGGGSGGSSKAKHYQQPHQQQHREKVRGEGQ